MVLPVKKNSAFFVPYFIFLLLGGIILIVKSETSIELFINSYHSPATDFFFKYWTLIGLGWLILPVALSLCFVRLRYVIMAAAAFLLTVIINDSLKFAVGAPRPAEVFARLHHTLYFVPGVTMDYWNSFPSGHSAVSFCLFCLLALIVSRKSLKFIFFMAAFTVAYSRMYLSEHFLIDVYTGSIIGVISAFICYRTLFNLPWLNKFSKIDKPVINLHGGHA